MKNFNLVILLGFKLDYRDQLGVQLKSYLAEGMFISTVSITITESLNTLESLRVGEPVSRACPVANDKGVFTGRVPGFLWMWSRLLFGVSAGVSVI